MNPGEAAVLVALLVLGAGAMTLLSTLALDRLLPFLGRVVLAVACVEAAKILRPFGWTWRQELYAYREFWRALR